MRGLLIALALLAAPAAAHAQDRIVGVAASDKEMNAAIARARAELPVFFGHVTAPGPNEAHFLIKYDIVPEPDRAEYVWAEIVSYKPGVTAARVVNEPDDKRFTLGQRVSVRDSEVIDWSYRRAGVTIGAYTTRVLIPRLPPEDQGAIKAALGW